MSSVYAGAGSDTSCLLLNQQHMIADTVRMIRHCQSDQPGEFFSLQSELNSCSGTEQRPAGLVRGSPGSASPLLTLTVKGFGAAHCEESTAACCSVSELQPT